MPTWNDILNEIQLTAKSTPNGVVVDYDYVRKNISKNFLIIEIEMSLSTIRIGYSKAKRLILI